MIGFMIDCFRNVPILFSKKEQALHKNEPPFKLGVPDLTAFAKDKAMRTFRQEMRKSFPDVVIGETKIDTRYLPQTMRNMIRVSCMDSGNMYTVEMSLE